MCGYYWVFAWCFLTVKQQVLIAEKQENGFRHRDSWYYERVWVTCWRQGISPEMSSCWCLSLYAAAAASCDLYPALVSSRQNTGRRCLFLETILGWQAGRRVKITLLSGWLCFTSLKEFDLLKKESKEPGAATGYNSVILVYAFCCLLPEVAKLDITMEKAVVGRLSFKHGSNNIWLKDGTSVETWVFFLILWPQWLFLA